MTKTGTEHNKMLPWIVWSLGAIFFFYEFLLQIAPGVMRPELMSAFSITATDFGKLASFYFIGYSLMQIPGGVLLDRFGPRILLTIACAFCAVGTLIFSTVQHFGVAEFSRFVTGLGSAFAMLGTLVLAANWFPTKRFAFLHGLLVTIGMLGAIAGEAPIAILIGHMGWRTTIISLGGIGILLTLLIWLIVRDRPTYTLPGKQPVQPIDIKTVLLGLLNVIKSKQSWIISIYAGLMYAPTPAMAWWAPSFIVELYGTTRSAAAVLTSLIFVGWAIGCPLFGALSDHLGRRKTSLYISSVGTLISILMILYLHQMPTFLLGILLFAFGFFTCGFVPSFSIIRELHPAKFSGTALGFLNMLNNLGGVVVTPIIGILLDIQWSGAMHDGARFYTPAQFHNALSVIPVCFILALLVLPAIKETYCKTAEV